MVPRTFSAGVYVGFLIFLFGIGLAIWNYTNNAIGLSIRSNPGIAEGTVQSCTTLLTRGGGTSDQCTVSYIADGKTLHIPETFYNPVQNSVGQQVTIYYQLSNPANALTQQGYTQLSSNAEGGYILAGIVSVLGLGTTLQLLARSRK